jgi:hypothetical protein
MNAPLCFHGLGDRDNQEWLRGGRRRTLFRLYRDGHGMDLGQIDRLLRDAHRITGRTRAEKSGGLWRAACRNEPQFERLIGRHLRQVRTDEHEPAVRVHQHSAMRLILRKAELHGFRLRPAEHFHHGAQLIAFLSQARELVARGLRRACLPDQRCA